MLHEILRGPGIKFLALTIFLAGCLTSQDPPPNTNRVIQHSDTSFEEHRQEEQRMRDFDRGQNPPSEATQHSPSLTQPTELQDKDYDSQKLVAIGYGDLSKGLLTCQRVSDMAARAELAKLIRVRIKQHATDRIRERTGKPVEQDIEVVLEEEVNERLQNVQIVDRKVNKASGMCSSTAVMPKIYLPNIKSPNSEEAGTTDPSVMDRSQGK